MSDLEDYTWKGDTWYTTKAACPECHGITASNGRVLRCQDCSWWRKLEDDEGV